MTVISSLLAISFIVLSPNLLLGQDDSIDFIQLKSGNFMAPKNFPSITRNQSSLKTALFQDNYHVVIQFKNLPSVKEKQKLKDMCISLIDYLPQKAYTSVIPSSFDFSCLKIMPINSIFILKEEHKLSAEIVEVNKTAIKKKENKIMEVNITLFQKYPVTQIEEELARLQASIVSEQPDYRGLVINLPIFNLYKLAALPFVQWVEPVAPPDAIESN